MALAKVASQYGYNGFVEKVTPISTPAEAIPIYKEMSEDAVINGVLDSIRIAIHEATYELEAPPNPSPQERKITSILSTAIFEKFDFKRFLKSATNNLIYGFQVFEIEMGDTQIAYKYKYNEKGGEEKERTIKDTYFSLINLYALQPETMTEEMGARNRRGELLYLTQNIDGDRINLEREKLLIINTKSFSDVDWRGESPLKAVYDPWFMKQQFWLIQGNMLEKWGPGIDVITLPVQEEGVLNSAISPINEGTITVTPQKLKELREKAQDEVNDISDGVAQNMVLNAGYQFEVIERQSNFPDILSSIQECKDNIVTALIAPQLKLGGTSSSGSYALSLNFSDLYIQSVQGRANDILDIFNRDIIKVIVDENFGTQQRYPKIIVSNIASTSKDLYMSAQNFEALKRSPSVLQKAAAMGGAPISADEAQRLIDEGKQEKILKPKSPEKEPEKKEEENEEEES